MACDSFLKRAPVATAAGIILTALATAASGADDRLDKLMSDVRKKAARGDEEGARKRIPEIVRIGPAALDVLVPALKDPDVIVRRVSATALSDIRDPRAAVPLAEAMGDEDNNVGFNASSALRNMGDAAIPAILSALNDRREGVRIQAAGMLTDRKEPEVVRALIAALRDASTEVRLRSVEGLKRAGDPAAIEPLITLARDPERRVRIAVANALNWSKVQDLRAFDAFMTDALFSPSGPSADIVLGARDQAIPTLLGILSGGAAIEKANAARLLVRIADDPRAAAALSDALKRRDAAVIDEAYEYYAKRVEPGTEPILVEALQRQIGPGMAEVFLNSANDVLAKAAAEWAEKKGLEIRFREKR